MTPRGFVIFLAVAVLAGLGIYFVGLPLSGSGNAIIYSQPANFRLGDLVRKEILLLHPEAKDLEVSLQPDDLRKGPAITSPGTAHLFGKKVGNAYVEKMTCRYRSIWREGFWGRMQFRPSSVVIESCAAVD